MASSKNGHARTTIDKRDFDANRPLLRDCVVEHDGDGRKHRRSGSDGLLSDVVEGIVERDRRKMKREVIRVCSFIWGVISW